MDLTNFKEKVQILLKLKELLIPQIDGNYIKEWENEAIKYQRISENIIVELKNISYVERLVTAISSQLSYLRINLQKYQNMSEQEKDKFKRLYVLAALGLIAKLKLILFFITYINSVEHNNHKNLYNIYENDFSSQQKVCEHSYDNKINASINSDNYINNKDIKKNMLFNNLDHYYSQFQNDAKNYKDHALNMMILNNLSNYNAQDNSDNFLNGNTSNEKDLNIYNNNQYNYLNNSISNNSHISNNTYNYNGNSDDINNNINNNANNNYSNNINNSVNSISNKNINSNNISNNNISNNNANNINNNNYNYNYDSHFINNLEDHSMAMMNNYASQENDNLQNSCIIKSKKRPFISHINQNKPTKVVKPTQAVNCINNNHNEQMLNYNNNNQINNESHKFIHQNQEQIFKYLTNVHQNMNLSSNEISELPNYNLNACYQLYNDNIQAKNSLLPHNNGLWY